jgi:glycosyltransferase involved in cell wall biosynthesis
VPKFLFRAPLILDLDDLGSEVMRLQKQPAVQVKLVAWCEQLALRFADAVVVTSTYLESLVKEQYPHKPVLLLSNGVSPEEYIPSEDRPLRNAIYYYGAINRLSLIETLLRALPATVAQVPDVRVTILGDGSALYEAKALVDSLGVGAQVSFAGWTDARDLPAYVQAGDIAVCIQPDIPTVRAASNLKVFQYMGLGSASVVSDVGDLGRYVKQGDGDEQIGVVVPPEDPEALARVLVAMLKDKQGRKRMGKKARVAAETEYAWSVLAGKLDCFLRERGRHSSGPGLDGGNA